MKLNRTICLFFAVSCSACTATKQPAATAPRPSINTRTNLSSVIKRDTATWVDSSRNRAIPVAIYTAQGRQSAAGIDYKQKLAIINPGYGGKSTDYGYIAYHLAARGYFVVTIQHDLPSDPPLPTSGNIYQLRLPFWNTGVKSIVYVIDRLKRMHRSLDYSHLVLIGHSNGGDMAMLIASQYPQLAGTVISLDNRRAPIPRASSPQIFSIRSSDQPADEGVLPSAEEQEKYHIKIVKVNTTHGDMSGPGTDAQKEEINSLISGFLDIRP